jgi:hypothetical protein
MVTGEDKYAVFVSRLSVGSGTFNPLQFQLLIGHITGHLGDDNVCYLSLLSVGCRTQQRY